MAVEKTDKDLAALLGQVSNGEIKLPEIQRAYVWKPTQIAKLVESLYRGYPSGSLLFWRTSETPETRAVAANAPVMPPAALPLYLLDGQQRLTSLHRVFDDHPQAQIVFNVETEAFQNQSAATKKDPRWVKVHDLVRDGADVIELLDSLLDASAVADRRIAGQRLQRVAHVAEYRYHMEILTDLAYGEVTQIFVRVNSGGRALKTTDLALATLSARWPGVLGKLEDEADHWRARGYGDLDVTFLTRALTGAVLGRGLSAWSHGRLAAATDEELETGWATVQRGVRHLVPLLQSNLKVSHSSLLPSVNVLLPLVVLLGERAEEKLDADTADGILYWLLVATIRTRYSSSADTLLGQDIPAARQADPVRALLSNLGVAGTRVTVTEDTLTGRTVGSPYFFLSFLVAQRNSAKDWWYGAEISAAAEGSQRLEYHHIHPKATLKAHPKTEVNDLANLAFISGTANRKIRDRSPAEYFAELTDDELTAHFVPLDPGLRTASSFRSFLGARRASLATAMTRLVDVYRPAWLDEVTSAAADVLDGCTLELTVYESDGDTGRIVAVAHTPDATWTSAIGLAELEAVLDAAAANLDADLAVAGETVPVRVADEDIEIPIGPFLVVGAAEDWRQVIERERADRLPSSDCPLVESQAWTGQHIRFPVLSSE